MRTADWGDLVAEGVISEWERSMWELWAESLPRCAICGVLVVACPEPRMTLCSIKCALEFAKREEKGA